MSTVTRVTVEGSRIVVRLGLREALAARRRTVRVPVAALRALGVEPSWWRVLRGEAARGVWRPGHCVGLRHGPAGTDFVAVRAEEPALWMELGPESRFALVAVSVPNPEHTARALRVHLPAEPLVPGEPAPSGLPAEPGRREGRAEPGHPPDPEERRIPAEPAADADEAPRHPGRPGRKLWEKPWEP
ncbi:hypothetical protein ACF065_05340 [Streptomyces sp. NPDC015232]|uniref:hypothetical protein n=1 Tax=unclassified Streptomyces TaxID=2593676 RepID=UPI0036F91104